MCDFVEIETFLKVSKGQNFYINFDVIILVWDPFNETQPKPNVKNSYLLTNVIRVKIQNYSLI